MSPRPKNPTPNPIPGRRALIRIAALVIVPLLSLAQARTGDLKTITILQTTDIHCQLDDHEGGWSRLATLIKNERGNAGADATVLIDCGDSVQGTFVSSATRGAIAIDALNALDYDVWIPGNHEFDYGMKSLLGFLERVQCPILAANLSFPNSEKHLKPWTLISRNGVKIAVIGLTLPFLKNWLWGGQFDDVRIDDVESALDEVIADVMKAQPHMIIVAAHHGLFPHGASQRNSFRKIARKYPQIDLILGGHTHQEVPGVQIGPNTWYAEAGCRGQNLLVVKAQIDPNQRDAAAISSKLVRATRDVPRDQDFLRQMKPELDKARRVADTVVGRTETPLASMNGECLDHPLNDLFCAAIAENAKTDAAFHSSVRRNTRAEDTLTNRDLFSMIPYENTIGVLFLSASDIKRIASEQDAEQDPWRRNTSWGIQIPRDADGSVDDGPVLKANGEAMNQDERITVAFGNFSLAGSGGRHPVLAELARSPQCHPRDTKILVRDALRKYIKKHSPLENSHGR